MPELQQERDLARHVKRDEPILVILGNPPYSGYAGVAIGEERDLSNAYWKNMPLRVWEYTIGGYQVMKKWLSYREKGCSAAR